LTRRVGHLAKWYLSVWLIAFLPLAESAGGIYGYTGNDGTVFLSNIPDDNRYSPLVVEKVPPAVQPARPPALSMAKPAAKPGIAAYLAMIVQAAQEHRLDPALVQAVVAVESGYDARALSGKGATGLMQLMPDTASRYGVSDLNDPAQNLNAGARHLSYLLGRYNCDLSLALAAYNAGEGAVKRHGNRVPPYAETVAYVPMVLHLYEKLRNRASARINGASPRSDYGICPMGNLRIVTNL